MSTSVVVRPGVALRHSVRVHGNNGVGDGEFGSVGFVSLVLTDPKGVGDSRGEAARQVMEESAVLRLVRSECADCFEAVDDEDARLEFLHQAADFFAQTLEATRHQRGAEIVLENCGTDRVGVEEGQRFSVAKYLVEGL